MPATQKTIDKFRETILNATTPEHKADILELKFGCNVLFPGNSEIEKVTKIEVMKQWHGEIMVSGSNSGGETNSSLIKIIGRDLTLEDVMMAFNNQYTNNPYHRLKIVRPDIFYHIIENDLGGQDILDRFVWQLTKPHYLQSEETLQSIIKILE